MTTIRTAIGPPAALAAVATAARALKIAADTHIDR
jgi:hypothetical protein